MDTLNLDTVQPGSPEADNDRKRWLVRESTMIAKADAEIEAGLYVYADEIDVWIDSIGTDHELLPPNVRHV